MGIILVGHLIIPGDSQKPSHLSLAPKTQSHNNAIGTKRAVHKKAPRVCMITKLVACLIYPGSLEIYTLVFLLALPSDFYPNQSYPHKASGARSISDGVFVWKPSLRHLRHLQFCTFLSPPQWGYALPDAAQMVSFSLPPGLECSSSTAPASNYLQFKGILTVATRG